MKAQSGGQNTFDFLRLPHTARVGGLGGSLIMIRDDDAALGYHNPSLLNVSMHKQINFNNSFYVAGINHGFVGYTHHLDKSKMTMSGGIQYITYGQFDLTDPTGQVQGEFKPSEYAFNVGFGKQHSDKLSYGANLKAIYSKFEIYNAFGAAIDLGATYQDTSKNVSFAVTVRNAGLMLDTYLDNGEKEPLPFDVQIGIAKQLRYLPLRFSITYHDLHRWNLRYNDPNSEEPTSLFGEQETQEKKFGVFMDNFFRHFIVGIELLAGKKENFRLRVGYNHNRRADLNVAGTRGLAGFSGGLGLKIKQFRFEYGIVMYHLAGATNQISIATNLTEFKK